MKPTLLHSVDASEEHAVMACCSFAEEELGLLLLYVKILMLVVAVRQRMIFF
jgi:hypothetical protein